MPGASLMLYDIVARKWITLEADAIIDVQQYEDDKFISAVTVRCPKCDEQSTVFVNHDAPSLRYGVTLAKRGGRKSPQYTLNSRIA